MTPALAAALIEHTALEIRRCVEDLEAAEARRLHAEAHYPGACIGHRINCECATCIDARWLHKEPR